MNLSRKDNSKGRVTFGKVLKLQKTQNLEKGFNCLVIWDQKKEVVFDTRYHCFFFY